MTQNENQHDPKRLLQKREQLIGEVRRIEPLKAEITNIDAQLASTPEGRIEAKAKGIELELNQTEVLNFSQLCEQATKVFERRLSGDETPIALPWPKLNKQLPLWAGLHMLVGGTGVGKTQWAMQVAHKAMLDGRRVRYVGLELDALGIWSRLLALQLREKTHPQNHRFHWSSIYRAIASTTDSKTVDPYTLKEAIAQAQGELNQASGEFIAEFPDMHGWHPSSLRDCGVQNGELIVIDFLQLVSSEPGERQDIRERIGRAAYVLRGLAREQGCVVLCISSTARNKYTIHEEYKNAGIDEKAPRGEVINPAILVGLGKESGDVEFAADSVTTLLKGIDEGRQWDIACATPKLRAGVAKWQGLSFDGTVFSVSEGKSATKSKNKLRKGSIEEDIFGGSGPC